jgi:hypothetical protein
MRGCASIRKSPQSLVMPKVQGTNMFGSIRSGGRYSLVAQSSDNFKKGGAGPQAGGGIDRRLHVSMVCPSISQHEDKTKGSSEISFVGSGTSVGKPDHDMTSPKTTTAARIHDTAMLWPSHRLLLPYLLVIRIHPHALVGGKE